MASPSAKPKILLLGTIDHPAPTAPIAACIEALTSVRSQAAREEWQTLSSIGELLETEATDRDEFIKECESGKFEGVVAAYRTFPSVSITGRVDEDLVKHLPGSLKFICHNGAGYDQVDVAACTSHGIHVSNVPTAVDDATADTTMFLILGALRNYNTSMLALREGQWRGDPQPPLGHDPQGKVLGILGMGGIGRNLKKKAEAFGMQVQYHNRSQLSEEMSGAAKYCSFEELLGTSDVISLNLPLNKNTRHIISTPEFEKMKPGVVIVNTARGAVMDEDALVEALDKGSISSCGLDVFEEEPKIHPGLVANPRVMLLPHMGTWTEETQAKMEKWNINNVRTAVETGKLYSPVPEQKDMA